MTEKSKRKKYRAHGDGSLERRGKMYIARWMVNGKRFTRSTGEHEIDKARDKLEEFTRPYRIGNEIDALHANEVKIRGHEAELRAILDSKAALRIDQLFNVFKAMPECQGLSDRHVARYERVLRLFNDWILKHRPEMTEARRVSRLAAREYADYLTSTFAASSRNIWIRLLRYVWRSIMKKENIENEEREKSSIRIYEDSETRARFEINPWDDIESISLVGKEHGRRELTVEELKRVCGYVTGEMRTLFAIGIYTGMRLADCVLLNWGEVDMVRRRISVVPRKTRKKTGLAVVIPIHPVLYGVLSEVKEDNRHGAILPECAAMYIKSQSKFSDRITAVFKACNIETKWDGKDGKRARCDVGFHSLRHTFVSMAANAGASLDLVRKIVGHTTAAMTQHYFHADEGALRNTVLQLPDITGGAFPGVGAVPDGSRQVVEAESIEADNDAPLLSSVRDGVRRLSVGERAEIVRAAVEGLTLAEIEVLKNAIDEKIVQVRCTSERMAK